MATVQSRVFILNADTRHKNDRVAEMKTEAVAMVYFLKEVVEVFFMGLCSFLKDLGFIT